MPVSSASSAPRSGRVRLLSLALRRGARQLDLMHFLVLSISSQSSRLIQVAEGFSLVISWSCWSRWIASEEVFPGCTYSASVEDLAQHVCCFEDPEDPEMAPSLRLNTACKARLHLVLFDT